MHLEAHALDAVLFQELEGANHLTYAITLVCLLDRAVIMSVC